jgi:hypothetical protein
LFFGVSRLFFGVSRLFFGVSSVFFGFSSVFLLGRAMGEAKGEAKGSIVGVAVGCLGLGLFQTVPRATRPVAIAATPQIAILRTPNRFKIGKRIAGTPVAGGDFSSSST